MSRGRGRRSATTAILLISLILAAIIALLLWCATGDREGNDLLTGWLYFCGVAVLLAGIVSGVVRLRSGQGLTKWQVVMAGGALIAYGAPLGEVVYASLWKKDMEATIRVQFLVPASSLTEGATSEIGDTLGTSTERLEQWNRTPEGWISEEREETVWGMKWRLRLSLVASSFLFQVTPSWGISAGFDSGWMLMAAEHAPEGGKPPEIKVRYRTIRVRPFRG